jgi:hypothetical protein
LLFSIPDYLKKYAVIAIAYDTKRHITADIDNEISTGKDLKKHPHIIAAMPHIKYIIINAKE